MISTLETVTTVATTDADVLLEGETGTGKELIARAIHENSPRARRIMVTLNCGAFHENLLDSELFGHVRGAFTGAMRDKEGHLARADGGTLFLDEVSEMSANLQVKLLRVLQFGEYSKLGSHVTEHTDIRCICASNKDLKKLVEDGKFREDLYYRLFDIKIQLPPLRNRKNDIPLLVEHFIKIYSAQKNIPMKTVSPQFIEVLMNYLFPGNVRELEHMVKRAMIVSRDDVLHPDHLPAELTETIQASVTINLTTKENLFKAKKDATESVVRELEEKFLRDTLTASGGSATKASEKAGMNRSYYQRLMKKYGISAKDFRGK
jgi:transcriptional regulator with GAF, ATPase, and Fis domain